MVMYMPSIGASLQGVWLIDVYIVTTVILKCVKVFAERLTRQRILFAIATTKRHCWGTMIM